MVRKPLAKPSDLLHIAIKGTIMYAKHYHHYDPSGTSHIMDRFRKMGWVPPSEDKTYRKKWKYFQECAWRKDNAKQHA